jgi:hypothetical protein
MRKFVIGMAVGLFIGATVSAWAAGIFGSGELSGWTVTKDGEEVCSDPSVDASSKEIECE